MRPVYKLDAEQRAQLKEEMRGLMIDTARARSTITYSELAAQMQTARVHYHSFLMAKLLDEIGGEEIQAGRGVLPAVVVRKSSGMPGGGYFRESAQLFGTPQDAPPPELEALWRDDLEAVYAYWAEHE